MKRKHLESKINEFSQAINILRGNNCKGVIEALKRERGHYLFLYEKKYDICYFENQLNERNKDGKNKLIK